MRRIVLALATACMFAAALLAPLTAAAESNLGVSTTITPETLVQAGTVEITLKIANNGSAVLEDVTLAIPGKNDAVLGNLGPGEKKSFLISNFSVSDEQIGVPISFRFKWNENGSPKALEYPVTIGVKNVNSALDARRDLSKSVGASGDTITVTYVLENKGNVDLTDISITDPISDKPIASGLTLAVGSGVKKVNFELKLTKSVTSKPVVKATGGGQTITVEIPAVDIVMSEPKMEITPTLGTPSGNSLPVNILVKNTGNVALKNITLTDEKQKQIQSGLSLAAGEEKTIPYAVTANEVRTLVVTATATVEGVEGSAAQITFLSTGIELTSSPLPSAPVDEVLAITVTPSADKLETAGEVEFAIRLNNASGEALKNVTIKEKKAGEVKEFPDLKIGLTTVKAKFNVSNTSTFEFYVEYSDAAGTARKLSAEPVKIEVTSGGSPEKTSKPSGTGSGPSVLTLIMIGLGVLLAAAVAGLVIVLSQERRRKEQRMESEELDRMMEHRSQKVARTGERPARPSQPVQPTPPADEGYRRRPPRETPREATREATREAPRETQGERRYTPVETPAERPPRTRPRSEPFVDVEPTPPSKSRSLSDEELFEREFMDDE